MSKRVLYAVCSLLTINSFAAQSPDEISRLIAHRRTESSAAIREAASDLIRRLPPATAVQDLIEVIKHNDSDIREVAAYALGMIGRAAQPAIPALTQALADTRPKVRQAAVEALGKIGGLPESSISALSVALGDTDSDVQRAAAFALAETGPGAAAVVPALISAAGNEVAEVRRVAVYALGRIGPPSRPAVAALMKTLQDENPKVREVSAYTLGRIGVAAKSALPALITALRDSDKDVRRSAAEALQSIGTPGSALSALLTVLRDDDARVRQTAADALGHMGLAGRSAFTALINQLGDNDPSVRGAAAEAIASLALALQDSTDWKLIPVMKKALAALKAAGTAGRGSIPYDAISQVEETIHSLNARRRTSWVSMLFGWTDNEWAVRIISIASVYITWFALLRFLILRWRPLWLLAWNDALANIDFPLPGWLGGARVPARHMLLIGFFHYHERVLKAWVDAHAMAAYQNFKHRETYKARATYVPLPVVLNGEIIPRLDPGSLRAICSSDRWCVHISGEGGSGKTTLACQMALWAISDNPEDRLIENRRMLPIMIEPGQGVDILKSIRAFIQAIRGQLQLVIGAADPISERLLERLLRGRHVMVVLDGLSEMTDHSTVLEERARYDQPEFPASALVVTSRTDVWKSEQPSAFVSPLRLDTNHLLPFINAYLSKGGDVLGDHEMYDACRRLAEMVGTHRGITPLLARLYTEEIISACRGGRPLDDLPVTIPDLMLGYLNNLNRHSATRDRDNPTIHRAVEVVAKECLKRTFRPAPAREIDLLAALEDAQLDPKLLSYLEKQLGIVQRLPPAETDVQFALDPVAEYLASLGWVATNGSNDYSWQKFFRQADSMPGAPDTIRGLLVALHDSCVARQNEHAVRTSVIEELERRINFEGSNSASAVELGGQLVEARGQNGKVEPA